LGFEKMVIKNESLKCFFINRPDSPYFESELFNNILAYMQTGTNKARLKQVGKLFMLVMEPAKDMQDVYTFLKRMHVTVLSTDLPVET
jgi:transcription-repair coupling factor (superfamily II helicase)